MGSTTFAFEESLTKPTPTVDAPTAPPKEVLRTISTRDLDKMSYYAAFPERAIDVTKNFSSLESQGFYVIVSLLNCLPQHQSQPMPIAKEQYIKMMFLSQVFLGQQET